MNESSGVIRRSTTLLLTMLFAVPLPAEEPPASVGEMRHLRQSVLMEPAACQDCDPNDPDSTPPSNGP
ncbi:MAG: hypothetical protein ACPGJE_08130, partial [Wenzhouxiangellaceae bacterium]